MRILKPVESSNFVRAVVGTITRSNAAVVNLFVEPFVTVYCCQYWTDGFARSVVAVLTHHRLVRHGHIVIVACVISVDTEPVHFPLPSHFIFAHNRDIVLRLTRGEARRASRACVQINRHAPAMPILRMIRRPKLNLRAEMMFNLSCFWIFREGWKCRQLHNVSHFSTVRRDILRDFQ